MTERGPLPSDNSIEQISNELGVEVIANFRGAHIHRRGYERFDPEATVFLVADPNGDRSVVKIKNFNEDEVEKTDWMRKQVEGSEIWSVPRVIGHKPGSYIRTTFFPGRPVGLEDVWRRKDLMDSVIYGLQELETRINRVPLEDSLIPKGKEWVWGKLELESEESWVKPALDDQSLTEHGLITKDFINDVRSYAKNHASQLEDVRRTWRDPNGDHIIELRDGASANKPTRLGMVDIDIQPRPRHYMPMRFLAWSLLRIGSEDPVDAEAWVKKMREQYELGEEMDPTFVLSLTGILHDLATGERDNKNKRLIALSVKDIINSIIKKDAKA